jgi:2-methylcitrate dehydratase
MGQDLKLGPYGDGGRYKIEGTFFKSMPVRYTTQLPIEIAIGMRDEVEPADVEKIVIHVVHRYVISKQTHPEGWDPRSRETADHSMPYLVSVALIDGEISPDTFTPKRYRDPQVLQLVDKIEFVEDPAATEAFPQEFRIRIDVHHRSGTTVTATGTNPKGHPANPMSDDEISAKFRSQARPLLGEDRTDQLLDTLWRLEDVADVRDLFPLMLVDDAPR